MCVPWKREIFEAKTWSEARGHAGAEQRELGDVQIKRPRGDTLMVNVVKIICRHVCPCDAKTQVTTEVKERYWSQ